MKHLNRLFLFLASAVLLPAGAYAGTATIHPSPAGVAASPLYEVEVNGKPVFVYPCRVGDIYDANGAVRKDPPETTTAQPAAFCSFDMEGAVEVKVRLIGSAVMTPSDPVIRPLKSGVKSSIEADGLHFTIPNPGQYSVEPRGSTSTPVSPLLIFANPPETDIPNPKDPNVLFFGPGEHVIGWKSVKSGQTVYLAGGAVVYGHLIIGNAKGVKIMGRGILDSSRSPRKGERKMTNEFGRRDVQMHIGHCHDVLVEGICLVDSPAWTLHVLESSDITIRNVKIITWRENGDGIDVNNSQRIHVSDCFLRTWDDALVVKATLGPPTGGKPKSRADKWVPDDLALYPAGLVRDITFENCVVWLDRAHALEIGLETSGTEIANITYRNIDIIHDNHLAAIDIGIGDRARVHHILYENIRIEDSHAGPLIRLYTGPCYTSIDNQMGLDYGPISDVTFNNVDVLTSTKPRILLEAQSINPASTARIDRILFQNLKINGKPAGESAFSQELKGPIGGVRFTE